MEEKNNEEKLKEAKGIQKEIKQQVVTNVLYFAVIVMVFVLWILLGMLTIRQLWWLSSVQKTLFGFVLVIFVITVLTVMAALAVRFLHKRMTEKDKEITRWRTKLLDAYNCLLELEVNVIKTDSEINKKNKQLEELKEEKQQLESEIQELKPQNNQPDNK